jgi:transcriptional regulator with XRE-family HTH domain
VVYHGYEAATEVNERPMRQSANFADAITRLAGFHGLRPSELPRVLGVSGQAVSKWRTGRSEPGTAVLARTREVFEVDSIALLSEPFASLLPVLCDENRFVRVEERLRRERPALRTV